MNLCLFGDARSAHIQCLARYLSAGGDHIHIVTHKPADVAGATVERFCVPGASWKNPRRWRGRWEHYLLGFLRRFDVVNVHFLLDWGFTPEIMRQGRLVASAWGSDIVAPPGEEEPSAELRTARMAMLQHADAVTTCGPTFAATVAQYAGLPVEDINIAPFGVDLDHFNPSAGGLPGGARESPPANAPYRVGFYKGFREVYGPATLIRAIPMVLKACPTTRFQLIGDGPRQAECVALAEELGVASHIEWKPRQPHTRIAEALAGWDISVIPSVHEAFGVAALESSAIGVPVVASDVGGLRDTVRHGETGLLVPPGSPAAFANAIIDLLRDDRRRRQMGEVGRRWVREHFDWRHVVGQWVRLFQRVREQTAGTA